MLNLIEFLMYTGEMIFFTGLMFMAQTKDSTTVLLAVASYCIILFGTAMYFTSKKIGGKHGK